jgi:uncharacterized protein YkwD
MALGRNKKRTLLIAALAGAAMVLLFGPTTSQSAAADACTKWGSKRPAHLTTGEARKAIVCLINHRRHDHGKGHLHADRRLRHAAQKHSRYMRRHHCFSHQCGGEGSPQARIQSTGYINGGLSRWSYGENIGWGPRRRGSPRAIVNSWMHSAPHRANILSGTFKDMGVGYAKGSPSNKGAHAAIYTVDFGMRAG